MTLQANITVLKKLFYISENYRETEHLIVPFTSKFANNENQN